MARLQNLLGHVSHLVDVRLLNPQFLLKLLHKCQQQRHHDVIDTNETAHVACIDFIENTQWSIKTRLLLTVITL